MKFHIFCLALMSLLLAASPGFAADGSPECRVGFVYVSPVGDAGWSYAHDLARQKLDQEPGVITYLAESVPEGEDSEAVFANMSSKGYDIIIGTSYGYLEPMLKVARQYPGITYLHCSGNQSSENLSTFFGRMYQARYLSGLVAGSMTRSGRIGYVAAFPIPEVVRGINAFTLGVREMNPEAEVRVIWTKSWYNPRQEKEAAQALIRLGADVVAQHQDSPGPQEAAQEAGLFSIGYNMDMRQFAPDAHLVAAVWNWTPFYMDMIAKVRAGSWKAGDYWYGMDSGIVDISPISEKVPAEIREKVAQRRLEIMDGRHTVFAGPLRDAQGNERLAADSSLSDKELLEMDWFVQGVVQFAQ
ncbi:BMP family ABC transporter substrate-binding protein [Desulfovibrio sp. OttesenSCG-928-A18]|nr:BMP family ABC transporter substrate-binding protein [Desulfovibrio sp. OttesenSCG-928-A18]